MAHAEGAAEAAQVRRHSWLHCRERASPALSRKLRLPREATSVPALRGAGGALHTGPAAAQRAAEFSAGVAAQPATTAAAQEEVLASLRGGRRLAPEQAAGLGSSTVTEQEVCRALRRGQPGKAPGLDGIPPDLYRRFRAPFAPILAGLFSAVASTGALPPRFHEGLITFLFKAGDRSDPAHYRSITLLGAEYRTCIHSFIQHTDRPPLARGRPTLAWAARAALPPGRMFGVGGVCPAIGGP